MAKTTFLFFILLYSANTWASMGLFDIWRNNQAVNYLGDKKALEAHDELLQLLSEQPFNPLFQYNMAFTFIATDEKKKAIQMYEEILKQKPLPPEVEFGAYFNLGVLYSMKGMSDSIDPALDSYQKALGLYPDSKEVKTNIELLFQGGGGKGQGENKKDSDKGEGEQPKEPQEFTNKPQQPNQFNSKEMSKGDVKKILEELKKQEQRIRAKHERKGKREADRDKDW